MFKMKKNFKSFCFLTEPVTGTNNRQLLSGIDKIIRQLDQLKINVQLDDPNIASTKTNTDSIITLLTQINSKMKTILVVTQAEYNLIDPKDPNTIYLITQDTQP